MPFAPSSTARDSRREAGKAIKTIFVDGEDLTLIVEGQLAFAELLNVKPPFGAFGREIRAFASSISSSAGASERVSAMVCGRYHGESLPFDLNEKLAAPANQLAASRLVDQILLPSED